MKTIAIITARSGSKGLKDKNIKMLNGKPMIAYTIEACIQSGCFTCVHVSTDSEKYAAIAREYGADVPFLRTEELSSDTATSEAVVKWTLEQYDKLGQEYDSFAIMQPTSPLRSPEDIKNSFAIYEEKDANAVIGVCEMDHSPIWSNVLPEDHSMTGFLDKASNVDRHHLPTYYRINGAMYLVRRSAYTDHTAMYGEKSYAYVMDRNRSIDIDTELDFKMAEFLMKNKK